MVLKVIACFTSMLTMRIHTCRGHSTVAHIQSVLGRTFVCVCKCTHVCLSRRRLASVFLICFPSYFLRQDLSLNRELVDLASLAVLGQSLSTSVTVVSTSSGVFFSSNVGTELKLRFSGLRSKHFSN